MEGIKTATEAGQKAFNAQVEAAKSISSHLDTLTRSQLGYAVNATKDASDFVLKAAETAIAANAKARDVAVELTQNAFAGFKA
jgi:hypothetical protein